MARKMCKYCRRLFDKYGIARHQASCKRKHEWEEKLSHEGIIAEPKKGLIHISGGMKIYLFLRVRKAKTKTEEDKKFKNNLDRIERDYAIRLGYNCDTDEITVKEPPKE